MNAVGHSLEANTHDYASLLSQRNETAFTLIRAVLNLVLPPAARTLFLVGSLLLDC